MRTSHLLALILSTVATAASAQAVRTERNMSLELANQIATATVAACSANGYAVTATVVDRAGSVRAVQRADNAGHTPWPPARKRPLPRRPPKTPPWP